MGQSALPSWAGSCLLLVPHVDSGPLSLIRFVCYASRGFHFRLPSLSLVVGPRLEREGGFFSSYHNPYLSLALLSWKSPGCVFPSPQYKMALCLTWSHPTLYLACDDRWTGDHSCRIEKQSQLFWVTSAVPQPERWGHFPSTLFGVPLHVIPVVRTPGVIFERESLFGVIVPCILSSGFGLVGYHGLKL